MVKMVERFKTEVIEVSKIKVCHFNPKSCLEDAKLASIKQGILEFGISNPLAVTSKLELGDGHRRLECARQLGWDRVRCNVFDPDIDVDRLYAMFNSTCLRMPRCLSPLLDCESVFIGSRRRLFFFNREHIGPRVWMLIRGSNSARMKCANEACSPS